MWTEILATYAAITSTSSLAVSYLTFKAGGPRLSGYASLAFEYGMTEPCLSVTAHNSGRTPITVYLDSVWVTDGAGFASERLGPRSKTLIYRVLPSEREASRIESHSAQSWLIPGSRLYGQKRTWNTADASRLRIIITRADGKLPLEIWAQTHELSYAMDFPKWISDFKQSG